MVVAEMGVRARRMVPTRLPVNGLPGMAADIRAAVGAPPSVPADGRPAAFAMDTPPSPAEVYVSDDRFSNPLRLTTTCGWRPPPDWPALTA